MANPQGHRRMLSCLSRGCSVLKKYVWKGIAAAVYVCSNHLRRLIVVQKVIGVNGQNSIDPSSHPQNSSYVQHPHTESENDIYPRTNIVANSPGRLSVIQDRSVPGPDQALPKPDQALAEPSQGVSGQEAGIQPEERLWFLDHYRDVEQTMLHGVCVNQRPKRITPEQPTAVELETSTFSPASKDTYPVLAPRIKSSPIPTMAQNQKIPRRP